ncbi:hypothetical protein C8Q78DRAFT_501979 [Trametes maxima]|nr:hypothetical protein C8Q78DRAFT_501979 [Trametes maxima]
MGPRGSGSAKGGIQRYLSTRSSADNREPLDTGLLLRDAAPGMRGVVPVPLQDRAESRVPEGFPAPYRPEELDPVLCWTSKRVTERRRCGRQCHRTHAINAGGRRDQCVDQRGFHGRVRPPRSRVQCAGRGVVSKTQSGRRLPR